MLQILLEYLLWKNGQIYLSTFKMKMLWGHSYKSSWKHILYKKYPKSERNGKTRCMYQLFNDWDKG